MSSKSELCAPHFEAKSGGLNFVPAVDCFQNRHCTKRCLLPGSSNMGASPHLAEPATSFFEFNGLPERSATPISVPEDNNAEDGQAQFRKDFVEMALPYNAPSRSLYEMQRLSV